MDAPRHTVIILSSGDSDGGSKATLAFSLGSTLLSAGQTATVFLIHEGCLWASAQAPMNLSKPDWKPVGEYINAFLDLNGKIVHCAVCDTRDKKKCGTRCGIRGRIEPGSLLDIAEAVQNGATVISI